MKRFNVWIGYKFAQYDNLTNTGKMLIWVLGFLVLFTIELIIAGICYECHIPMVNGWTGETVLKPY